MRSALPPLAANMGDYVGRVGNHCVKTREIFDIERKIAKAQHLNPRAIGDQPRNGGAPCHHHIRGKPRNLAVQAPKTQQRDRIAAQIGRLMHAPARGQFGQPDLRGPHGKFLFNPRLMKPLGQAKEEALCATITPHHDMEDPLDHAPIILWPVRAPIAGGNSRDTAQSATA